MSIEELWDLHEEVAQALASKLIEEKSKLERRLVSLRPAAPTKGRRPYPPVAPKFSNPDAPHQLWSGRGKQPRWVAEKLARGLALEDLQIKPARRVALMRA